MTFQEKRKHNRIETLIDGSFSVESNGAEGAIILSNLSKNGFKATLNREVELGQQLECEMRFPQSIMTFFITGKVIWIQENDRDQKSGFDAGIFLEHIDSIEQERLLDYAFTKSQNNDLMKNSAPIEIQP